MWIASKWVWIDFGQADTCESLLWDHLCTRHIRGYMVRFSSPAGYAEILHFLEVKFIAYCVWKHSRSCNFTSRENDWKSRHADMKKFGTNRSCSLRRNALHCLHFLHRCLDPSTTADTYNEKVEEPTVIFDAEKRSSHICGWRETPTHQSLPALLLLLNKAFDQLSCLCVPQVQIGSSSWLFFGHCSQGEIRS